MNLTCPRCNAPLFDRQQQQITGHLCDQCGGVWLGRGTAQGLSQMSQLAYPLGALARDAARRAPFGGSLGTTNVYCPICRGVMKRQLYQRAALIVDVCLEHGSWFDRGELQQLVEYIWPDLGEENGSPYRSPATHTPTLAEIPVDIPPPSPFVLPPRASRSFDSNDGIDEAAVSVVEETLAQILGRLFD